MFKDFPLPKINQYIWIKEPQYYLLNCKNKMAKQSAKNDVTNFHDFSSTCAKITEFYSAGKIILKFQGFPGFSRMAMHTITNCFTE